MVEEEFQQLRFDISENIRLHPQKPGIGTLLELDLFPDVECKDEGKNLKIEGYLRLNGVYLAEDQAGDLQAAHFEEEGREEIAYVIPVEITLPAERAEFDHISAEVESFDYSISSPFELQITAMLLIDGILPEPEEATAPEEPISEEPAFYAEPVTAAYLSKAEEEGQEEQETDSVEQQKMELEGEETVASQIAEQLNQSSDFSEEEPSKVTRPENELENDPVLQPREQQLLSQKDQQKREMSAKDEESLAKRSDTNVEEIIEQADETEQIEEARESDSENKVNQNDTNSPDWIRWLVRSREETYKPMRMVIVQQSQSIDYVADHYQLSKEELVAANNLKMDFIDEGEILYIPTERQSEARGL